MERWPSWRWSAVDERGIEGLDLRRRIQLVSGADFWSTHAEPAIGLRRLVLSDGPSGVRRQGLPRRA